ncbi:MAG: Hsp20/alpha crystallin family protein [Mycobacterium leprae]
MFQSLFDLMEQAGRLASLPVVALQGLDLPPFSQPALELKDDGAAFVLRAAMDGVDPKSVQIEATDRLLAISGRSTLAKETEGPDFYHAFAQSSHFYRQVPLPTAVNPAQAAAQWQVDGSLVVILPKR